MKTAISIPDDLFAEAEQLTRRLHKSRSQLYAEAVRDYIARHEPDAITEALNQLCERLDPQMHPAVAAAAGRTLERVEW